MDQAFELKLEHGGPKASLYKVHFANFESSEYDRFLDRLAPNPCCTADERNFCKWHYAHLGKLWDDDCWRNPSRCEVTDECEGTGRCQNPILCQESVRCRKSDMLDFLQVKLFRAAEHVCFHDDLFRPANNYPDRIRSIYAGALRLYGVRWEKRIFIAGDGGFKTEKRIYQDSSLGDRFDRVKYVRDRLAQKIDSGKLQVGDRGRKLKSGAQASDSPLLFEPN